MEVKYRVSISRDDDLLKYYRKCLPLSRRDRKVLRIIFGV
jgi:hypothetical protein